MQAGVRTARDLTWKDGLDAFTCTECGRCKDACPTYLTGKPLSLKGVNDSLKHHLLEQRERDRRGDPDAELPRARRRRDRRRDALGLHDLRLLRGGVPDRARAPRQVLPHAPAPGDDRRRVPARAEAAVRGLRVAGQPVGPAGRRARRLGARPRRADRAHAPPTWRASTTSSTSARRCRSIRAARRSPAPSSGSCARPACASASSAPREGSTGECVRRVGNEMLFQQLASALVATLAELGVTRIVTCDPHALNSLRNEYPELGGHYEVVHHTQLIAELLADGRIAVEPRRARRSTTTPATSGGTTANSMRRAPSSRASARRRRSSSRWRARRRCAAAPAAAACGSTRPSARASTSLRVEQALETSPQTIATACPYCAVMMEDGLAALPAAGTTRSRDIAELVADALVAEAPGAQEPSAATARPGPEAGAGCYLPEGTLRSRLPWWKRRLAG